MDRWRCRNHRCAVRFFTLPLAGVVEAYARETNRVRDLTLVIGHALGGLPGQRLMSRLNLPTSDDTILRLLKHRTREPITSEVRVIDVDEWAWSKGQMSRFTMKIEGPNLFRNNPTELCQGCHGCVRDSVIDGHVGQNPSVAVFKALQEFPKRDQIGSGNPYQPGR